MSVTFEAEMSTITGWTVRCACGDGVGPTFGAYQDGIAFLSPIVEDESLRTDLPGCDDPETCRMYRLSLSARESDPSPSVNMSNSNALDLFDALGLVTVSVDAFGDTIVESPSEGGSVTADDFMGRVVLALAVMQPVELSGNELEGSDEHAYVHRMNYVQGRLSDLREVAEFAVATGRSVVWA